MRECVLSALDGDGTIEDLEKAITRAKRLGASEYHVHLQYAKGVGAYVQMFEFARILSEKEVLERKRAEIQKKLDEVDAKISMLGNKA